MRYLFVPTALPTPDRKRFAFVTIAMTACLTATAQAGDAKSIAWCKERGYPCFGMVAAAAGDENRDGIPDFAVLDPCIGALYVMSGKDGALVRLVQLPQVDGAKEAYRLDGGMDANADGVADLLLAAIEVRQNKASVSVLSGADGSVLHRCDVRGPKDHFEDAWARFVGDYDHDGASDFAVLCPTNKFEHGSLSVFSGRSGTSLAEIPIENPLAHPGGSFLPLRARESSGAMRFAVLTGATSANYCSLRIDSSPAAESAWRYIAPVTWDDTPHEIVELNDLDGDGLNDLVESMNDSVRFVSGKSGTLIRSLAPTGKTDSDMGYGWALASLGDIDGDGAMDVAISETESGLSEGTVYAVSGKTGRTLWTCRDPQLDVWRLGYQLASLNDVDGDHVSDLVAGTWGTKGGAPGRVMMISGKTGSILYEVRCRGDGVVVLPKASTASAVK